MGLGFAVGEPTPEQTVTVTAMLNTPAAKLQQQINRFAGDKVPADLRFRQTPLPVNGVVDDAAAIAAVQIAQRRAIDATIRYADHTSIDLLKGGLATALANPLPYVTAHLDDFVIVLSNYADAKNLAGATTTIQTPVDLNKMLLIAGGLAVGYFLFVRKGAKKAR
jgi:hypothetical protein